MKSKLEKRLQQLRASAGAVAIQRTWRGYRTRKELKKALQPVEPVSSLLTSSNLQPIEMESYSDIPFEDIRMVQVCVDSLAGVGVNVCSTNVCCRVFDESGQQIQGASSANSETKSASKQPSFQFSMCWDKTALSPVMLVLLRFDVLETPPNRVSIMGYASIPLFTRKAHDSSSYVLNSGRFQVPVYYGLLKKGVSLTEETLKTYLDGALPGVFAYVRIFDPTVEKPPAPLSSRMIPRVDTIAYRLCTSVSCTPSGLETEKGCALPWQGQAKHAFARYCDESTSISTEELLLVQRLTQEWIQRIFDQSKTIKPQMMLKNFYEYNDETGFYAMLHSLYNVGTQTKSPGLMSFLTRKKGVAWTYKVTFQYLRGYEKEEQEPATASLPELRASPDAYRTPQKARTYSRASPLLLCTPDSDPGDRSTPLSELDPLYLLDDVSWSLDFASPEQYPHYEAQAPRRVHGMQLSSTACVLITTCVVKLQVSAKGKIGIYMDPTKQNNVMWGLCPLMETMQRSSLALGTPDTTFVVNCGVQQVPLFLGFPPKRLMTSPAPFSDLCSLLHTTDTGNLQLSSCASALVSVYDTRLHGLIQRMGIGSLPFGEDTLRRILVSASSYPHTDQAAYQRLHQAFSFDGFKYQGEPSIKDNLQRNASDIGLKSGKSLWLKISQLYAQTITDAYLQRLELEEEEGQRQ